MKGQGIISEIADLPIIFLLLAIAVIAILIVGLLIGHFLLCVGGCTPANFLHNGIPAAVLQAYGSQVYYSSGLQCPPTSQLPICANVNIWDGSMTTSQGIDDYSQFTIVTIGGGSYGPIFANGPGTIYFHLYLVNRTSGTSASVMQANSKLNAEIANVTAYLNNAQSQLAGGCSTACQQLYPAVVATDQALIQTFNLSKAYNNNILFSNSSTTTTGTTTIQYAQSVCYLTCRNWYGLFINPFIAFLNLFGLNLIYIQ